MDQTQFEADAQRQGYQEVVDRRMGADEVNPEHSHEFDARLLVLEGEITITCGGEERLYRAGDVYAITSGHLHVERSGREGVRYLAARRYPGKGGAPIGR
jgi:quercetin dioxygenase-like cupin family protein